MSGNARRILAILSVAATAGLANADAYYIEAESHVETYQTVTEQPESNWGSAMSAGVFTIYAGAPAAGYAMYNIPAGTVPAGTYYFAERGFEHYAHPRGLGIDFKATGGTDIFNGFTNFGYTYNPNNQSTDMGWMWAYTDFTSSTTIATITIDPSLDYSIRVSSVAGSPSNSDVFALLSAPTLPDNAIPASGRYISTGEVSTWKVNASGDWNTASNWNPVSPNGVDRIASFGSIITSPKTVYTDVPVTVGTLKFDNANGYQIAGQGSLTIEVSGGAGSINVAQGSHKINLPLIFASNTNVNVAGGATLTLADPTRITANKTVTKTGDLLIEAALTLESGASLVLGPGAATFFNAPSLASGAKIDVKNNAVTIDYRGQTSPAATVLLQLTSGYNDGTWNGAGITTSSSTSNAGLGWVETTSAESILVKFANYGDANLNGVVDSTDFSAFVAGYGKTTGGVWADGDFDYNGKVNTLDFNRLAGNFGATLPAAALGSVVPEPTSLALLACAGLMGLRRRK